MAYTEFSQLRQRHNKTMAKVAGVDETGQALLFDPPSNTIEARVQTLEDVEALVLARLQLIEDIDIIRTHGGVFKVSADAVTTIAAVDTWYQAEGILEVQDEIVAGFTLDPADCIITHAHAEPESIPQHHYQMNFSLYVENGNNDVIHAKVRRWVADTSSYEDITECHVKMVSAGSTRAGELHLLGTHLFTTGDRLEVWVKNENATADITLTSASTISINGI